MGSVPLPEYLALPLEGCHIIEASAGTGKTTALTLMYLSTVLAGIPPERILVVTFTTAAALEVRERIRSVLLCAREFLSGGSPEDFLPEARWLCERYLENGGTGSHPCELALLKFDLAPIHTIHAFCRSVLREMSFFLGAPFDITLVTSDREFKWETAVQLWREMVYGADPLMAELVASLWPEGPQSLLTELGDVPAEETCSVEVSEDRLKKAFGEYLEKRQGFREALSRSSTPDLPEDIKQKDRFGELLGDREIPALCLDPSDPLLVRFFSGTGQPALESLLEEAFAAANHVLEALRALFPALLSRQRSLGLVRREREGVETFDDLIGRVASAVLRPDVAPSLRDRYPVAFIDEFQDTSREQYAIFDRIYRTPRSGSALFMIGDPKQSIYRFRGADLDSYLDARQRTSGDPVNRLVSLTTNYRSVPDLIGAVNSFFERHPAPFLIPRIPFVPAVASGRRVPALHDPAHPPDSSFFLFGGKDSKDGLDSFALLAALEIRRLLSGEVQIAGRPVAPSDIAVLVKSRAHADRVRGQLDELGIPYSAPSPVPLFHTRESDEFLTLLEALLSPWNGSRITLVLSTRLFGWTAQRIVHLAGDPSEGNRIQDSFLKSSRLWRSHGIRAALTDLFFRESVWDNLLSSPLMMGRTLALIGRIEEHVPLYPFPEDQLSYMEGERRANMDERGEDIFFEEEGGGVRILTVYKSKGLEFPIVFLPFGIPGSRSSRTGNPLESEGEEEVSGEEASRAEGEENGAADSGNAEDIRLLYVALTRARERLYLFTPQQRVVQSSLRYLLQIPPDDELPGKGGIGKRRFACFGAALEERLKNRPGVVFFPPEIRETLAVLKTGYGRPSSSGKPVPDEDAVRPRELSGPLPPARGVTSFTAILRQGKSGEETFWEDPLIGDESDRVVAGNLSPEDGPAGPDFGVLVHQVLEGLGQKVVRYRVESGTPPSLDQVMAWTEEFLPVLAAGKDEHWEEAVRSLVRKTLFSPLSSRIPEPLVSLFDGRTRFEQSFLCPLSPGKATGPGSGMPSHLRGVIDVVLWVGNTVYLIDYKTNRLSLPVGDPYSPRHLGEVLVENRYDLQASIYSRAYLEHLAISGSESLFGGFLFLFLRGMSPEEVGSGVFLWRLPDVRKEEGVS